MSGGGGGMISRAMGNQGLAQGGAQYSAPQASSPYQSAFNSQQAPQQMQQQFMSPLVQQQMMRRQQTHTPASRRISQRHRHTAHTNTGCGCATKKP